MIHSLEIELTRADIGILATLIYEPVERIWVGNQWCCPHCLELNRKHKRQCACGVRRDSEPPVTDEIHRAEKAAAPLHLLVSRLDYSTVLQQGW
jgi:hypothetical protein